MPRLLAIDDKPDNLITTSALLKIHIPGCVVITAQSGQEGIERAKAEQPDSILLDIHMPGMDGFEVCRKLKYEKTTKHIPIILLTAVRTNSKDRTNGLNCGADAFLAKPINDLELAAQVRAMLRIKFAEDQLRREKDLLEEKVNERTKNLESTKIFLDNIIDSSLDSIVVTDSSGNIVLSNKTFHKLLGFSAEEILGKHVTEISPSAVGSYAATTGKSVQINEDFFNSAKNMVSRLREDGKIYNWERYLIRKDNKIVPVEMTIASYQNDSGETTGAVGIIRDITSRKKVEEQLRQAQKMEAIGTLSGGIAHDFNNILAAIMGYTELALLDMSQDNSIKGYLNRVLQSSIRAKDLIKQILSFSRSDDIERKPLQTHSIVKESIKMLRASIPSNIEIRFDIGKESTSVLADPTQMYQVLMNLCTNAAYAMQAKGGVLEITLNHVDLNAETAGNYHDLKPGAYVRLKVADTGAGIDPAGINRIFEPFFTTKEKGKGTGMGLSVVHGIVKSHGGAITVESELNKGTTFTILLPQVHGEEENEAEELKPVPTGRECILFVDDEELLVELGQKMLESLGYNVISKKSSIEAFEEFCKDPDKFDLIISDQTMPHMTGYDLARQAMNTRPGIPVILCSGYSDTVSPEKAKEAGIKEFIMKPINRREIAWTVRKVLDDRSFQNTQNSATGLN